MQETMILLTSRPYIKNSAALCSLREKNCAKKNCARKNYSKEHHLFSSIRNVVPRPTSDAFTKIRPW